MRIAWTVFFEDPFYVGCFERTTEEGSLSVARVVFGAEPSDQQLMEWLTAHYFELCFSPEVESSRLAHPSSNPKRRQRQAVREQLARGIGTRAQQALQMERERTAEQRKVVRRKRQEEEQEHKRLLRLERKKAKHRGH